MAETTPNPPGGPVPPKPAEAAKVQPKKETVRINLPPKPTAAPTIKIPAPSAVAAATPAPPAPSAAATATPASAPPSPTPAPTAAPAAQRAAPASVAPASAPRQAPAPRAATPRAGVSVVDTGLGIAAAILTILLLVRVFMLASS